MRIDIEEFKRLTSGRYVWDKPSFHLGLKKGRRASDTGGPGDRREYKITGIIIEPIDRRVDNTPTAADRRSDARRKSTNRRKSR